MLFNLRDVTIADLLEYWSCTETWRPIPGWPTYSVSSFGYIKGKRVGVLQPALTHGYHHVTLSEDGYRESVRVARIVALAFLGSPPEPDWIIAHKDGDRTNNKVGNLRWTNQIDNRADDVRNGTRCIGSSIGNSKLTEDQVVEIKERLRCREKQIDIAKDYGVSNHTICLINKGKIWRHVP